MSFATQKVLLLFATAVMFTFTNLVSVASATEQSVVHLETNCDVDLTLTANVGDTVVVTMIQPGCNGSNTSPGNFANFNNLNGTYYSPPGFFGTATGAGFLEYVAHTGGTILDTDYWNNLDSDQDDWYVMQSGTGGENVEVTTTLRATDGNGDPLEVGSTVANIYTEVVIGNPVEFAVIYAGPPTETDLANTGVQLGGAVMASACALALAALAFGIRRGTKTIPAESAPRF